MAKDPVCSRHYRPLQPSGRWPPATRRFSTPVRCTRRLSRRGPDPARSAAWIWSQRLSRLVRTRKTLSCAAWSGGSGWQQHFRCRCSSSRRSAAICRERRTEQRTPLGPGDSRRCRGTEHRGTEGGRLRLSDRRRRPRERGGAGDSDRQTGMAGRGKRGRSGGPRRAGNGAATAGPQHIDHRDVRTLALIRSVGPCLVYTGHVQWSHGNLSQCVQGSVPAPPHPGQSDRGRDRHPQAGAACGPSGGCP